MRKSLLTRRELAAHFAVNPQTIGKWERAGIPIAERGRPGKSSLFSIAETKAWLKAREKAAKTELVDLTRERARKERAQAILAEQTVAVRARDLIPRAEVEEEWTKEVVAVRAKLLAWPATLTDQLLRAAELGGVRELERVLVAAVFELLLELSQPRPRPKPKKKPARKKAASSRTSNRKNKSSSGNGIRASKKASSRKKKKARR